MAFILQKGRGGMKKGDFAKEDKRKLLMGIPDLNAASIMKLTEKQFQNYTESLVSSVNIFPLQRNKLEAAFRDKDYEIVLEWLKSIRNRLSQIYADNLVAEYDKHIIQYQDKNNIRHDKMRVFIDYLFSLMTMLFTDVQKALDDEYSDPKSGALLKIKERLYTVGELNADKIKEMTEERIIQYVENLSAFQENLHMQGNGLRGSFKIKQYASMMRWLSQIEESLAKIHADNLTEDCRTQIAANKDVNAIRHEKLEIFINYLLSSLNMLAADINGLNLPKLKR
jgi:aromatic ring-cleaving dioxygenase